MVKYRRDNTRRIKTQDFGENKYSKNIGNNTIRFQPQDFGGVRTAILSELACFFINNINDKF